MLCFSFSADALLLLHRHCSALASPSLPRPRLDLLMQILRMKVLFFFLLLLAAGHRCAAVTSSEDAAYMHLLAAATGADGTLGWKAGADPCDGGWAGVRCELGRVTGISVRAKGLAGSVPDAANGSLSALEDLDFGNNNITGRFPLLLLPRLTYLWLDGNLFTSMPETFFSGMPLLEVLNLTNNPVSAWTLPNDLHSLRLLHVLEASNAGIVGSLDGIFTNTTAGFPFPSLEAVCFAGNRMVGTPPDMRGGVITKLDLSSNLFSGPISFITGVASSIQHLKLSHNQFAGELPDFTDFAWLGLLSLDHNKITGVVPASLPQLSRITAVNLAGNLLQGPLPEFGKYVVTDLAEAAAGGSFCRLDRGPCDPEVAALVSIAGALGFPLIVARSWLRNDACAGWIGVHCDGQRRVTGINLSRLGLNGSLSSAFGSLHWLQVISMSGNNLRGEIPESVARLPSLRVLDVADNELEGAVPESSSNVAVWAEGNPELKLSGSSVSAPSISGVFVSTTVALLASLV
ncbi:hypothetical protein ACQJBY_031331 [Aegilops geniculata]